MDSTSVFIIIFRGILALFLLGVWVVIFYYGFRAWRKRKSEPFGSHTTVLYGAWQGHSLGTTTFDPDDMEQIERNLKRAGDAAAAHESALNTFDEP